MKALKFEYVWLDGYKPEPNLRSKTKVLNLEKFEETPEELPMWSFDGSSTLQAEGSSSDCLLKPVRVVKDPERENAYLVMAEVLNADETPHISNKRATYKDDEDLWLGFEQEYVFTDNNVPVGFPDNGYPAPQGKYYCSVGFGNVAARDIVEEHMDVCLKAGLSITGVNAEVMLGQWEYQLFGKGAKRASDDLWLSRYLLMRITERYGLVVELHPKPVVGDWNGSGMHANFSNKRMREEGGQEYFEAICEELGKVHNEHMNVYGSLNEMRLTGLHETQSIEKFSYGVSDRGASIRIPISVVQNGWKGYLEDRRPASNANPYEVTAVLLNTIAKIDAPVSA
jgi:glutamine synthetase